MAVFFERFREEVARYAEGVHELGDPAPAAALKGLPAELASFLRSWNGAELFVDAVTILPADRIAREGALVVFGETATGDRLALDADGAVWRLEEDTGEALPEGTSFARWLEGYVVAEGIVYDREGEFREDVFDERGEELTPAAAEKRERKALKIDPEAIAPAWRLARALARRDQQAEAVKVLRKLTARDSEAVRRFAWAWFDLGKLERERGAHAEAETAFARAAEADPTYEHAGWFAAHAARAAAARGDDVARARHATRALALDPGLAAGQKQAARTRLAEGEAAEARDLLETAAAVAPRDLEILDLLRKLKLPQ